MLLQFYVLGQSQDLLCNQGNADFSRVKSSFHAKARPVRYLIGVYIVNILFPIQSTLFFASVFPYNENFFFSLEKQWPVDVRWIISEMQINS